MKVKYTEDEVVEMDTVKGVREQGKRLLTMIFRKNNVMLLFLMPYGKAESVKMVFDYLEAGLGIEIFRRLFPVILTDNGSEFKKVDELELTSDETGFLVYRTSIFYCDPMASWQKEHPDLTQVECAKNLGIGVSTLACWESQFRDNDGDIPVIGSGNYASEEAKEIARLKRELRDAQDVLDVLKKAIGILGKD